MKAGLLISIWPLNSLFSMSCRFCSSSPVQVQYDNSHSGSADQPVCQLQHKANAGSKPAGDLGGLPGAVCCCQYGFESGLYNGGIPVVRLNSSHNLRAAVRSAISCGSVAIYSRPAINFSFSVAMTILTSTKETNSAGWTVV